MIFTSKDSVIVGVQAFDLVLNRSQAIGPEREKDIANFAKEENSAIRFFKESLTDRSRRT